MQFRKIVACQTRYLSNLRERKREIEREKRHEDDEKCYVVRRLQPRFPASGI